MPITSCLSWFKINNFSCSSLCLYFPQKSKIVNKYLTIYILACEQAFRGALAAGREKKGELPTTSLEVKYLHRKSRCEILTGGDDSSNDVITLSMFVYIRARFRFALIGGNLTSQSTGSHRGIGGGIQIPEMLLQALLPFPAPPPERPGELAHRLFTYQPYLAGY